MPNDTQSSQWAEAMGQKQGTGMEGALGAIRAHVPGGMLPGGHQLATLHAPSPQALLSDGLTHWAVPAQLLKGRKLPEGKAGGRPAGILTWSSSGPTNTARGHCSRGRTTEAGGGPTGRGEPALPTSVAPGPVRREDLGAQARPVGSVLKGSVPGSREPAEGAVPTRCLTAAKAAVPGPQGASWEHCGLPRRTEWLGGHG